MPLMRVFLTLTFCTTCLTGCGVYSFTGTTSPAKTITIHDFYNNTDLAPANIAQDFTNEIKNYFVSNTTLSIAPQNGELEIEGEIVTYSLTAIAPTASDDGTSTSSSTRLTIAVKVTYVDTLEEEKSFKDKNFSFYADFTNDQNLTDIESNLIETIFNRIINDIFNASVANW